ncbi:hypothetical protein J2S47_005133 [Streptomyces griseoviridis]|uniref:Uncharacterized protein n=1 Tax=Streptomyces griseoviridis TaxID=45398 RepID=A0ABT9LM89_STRGD|nr:hypothetical protein [Streptomyces griseoviridis]
MAGRPAGTQCSRCCSTLNSVSPSTPFFFRLFYVASTTFTNSGTPSSQRGANAASTSW